MDSIRQLGPEWPRLARLPWQTWPPLVMYEYYGADGSELQSMDEVYVLTKPIWPIADTIHTIDYFVGSLPGMGPLAVMTSSREDVIYAFEMFCIARKGPIMRAIVYVQRRWRRMRRERGGTSRVGYHRRLGRHAMVPLHFGNTFHGPWTSHFGRCDAPSIPF